VRLVIRIHDSKHNQQYNDRFNRGIDIKQGENRVRIPLENIRTSPAFRDLNMKEIAGMILFAANIEQPVDFYISNIWLD